jgi:putative endonuclease
MAGPACFGGQASASEARAEAARRSLAVPAIASAAAGRRRAFPSALYLPCFCLMFHVYILRSIEHPKQIYIGFSSVDMQTRLDRHNAGSTPATARCRPWKVAWHCTFPDKQKAMDFEAYLKSGSGRAFLHKRLIQ